MNDAPDAPIAGADPGALSRFREAQEGVYPAVLQELAAGRKRGHWMWFVLPQLKGLGRSPTSAFYGIRDLSEAIAYLRDPLLGARLRECVAVLLSQPQDSPEAIFGPVDTLKLRSSLTLFASAAERAGSEAEARLFAAALTRFFAGERCPLTLARLARDPFNRRP